MTEAYQRYSLARLLVALAVLAWALGYVVAGGGGWSDWRPFVDLSMIALVVQIGAALRARRGKTSNAFIYTQLSLDVAMITAFVHLAGGRGSLFVYLYLPIIAAGAWLLSMRGAVAIAAICSAGLVVLAALEGHLFVQPDEGALLLYFETMFQIFAFFLLALLTGYLGESLARTEGALAVERRSSRVLASEHDTVLDRVRAGVLTTDAKGAVTACNPFAQTLLGDVVGRPLAELFTIPDGDGTWEETRPSGGRWACTRAPLPGGGSVVVVDDITELSRMREAAERDQRLVEAGKLSASLAHEIRNPLAGLSGSLQLLREDQPSRLLDLALGEAERLNRLVEDYLSVSRRPPLLRQPVDVRAVAIEVCEAFGRDPRYRGKAEARVEGDAVVAAADADRLRQALWNLVLNGAQAMPRGGRVTIHVATAEPADVEVRVEDDGVGIPEADRDRVFDPFHSTRSGGTGLGLAVVDQVVRAHGGTIRVEARVSGGTSFVVRLPREAPPGA